MNHVVNSQDAGAAERLAQERLGNLLDGAMSMDFGGRGVVSALYRAVREAAGEPLTLKAARVLTHALAPGRVAVLATGFPVRPWISPAIGETDGPPGVAGMARALSVGLQAIPVVTVPTGMAAQVRAALIACGVLILSLDEARNAVAGSRPTCCAVVCERIPGVAAPDEDQVLMQAWNPAALIAVEHPGRNAAGVYSSSMGVDISAGVVFSENLFDLAGGRGVPRFSFIDNVNEIGVGSIPREVLDSLCFGPDIAGVSQVDHLVVGATANWAAYATVAAMAALLDKPQILLSRKRDADTIAAVMRAGGLEGVSGSIWPEDGVDAIPAWVSGHMVDLFAYMVRSHREIQRRGRY